MIFPGNDTNVINAPHLNGSIVDIGVKYLKSVINSKCNYTIRCMPLFSVHVFIGQTRLQVL
jgi:hypothetical protein